MWLSTKGNCFTAGGFPSNPIPVRVCAEQLRYILYISEMIIYIEFRPPGFGFNGILDFSLSDCFAPGILISRFSHLLAANRCKNKSIY
jgi:hypothetical protein